MDSHHPYLFTLSSLCTEERPIQSLHYKDKAHAGNLAPHGIPLQGEKALRQTIKKIPINKKGVFSKRLNRSSVAGMLPLQQKQVQEASQSNLLACPKAKHSPQQLLHLSKPMWSSHFSSLSSAASLEQSNINLLQTTVLHLWNFLGRASEICIQCHLLLTGNLCAEIIADHIDVYTEAWHRKYSVLDNCWGLLYGTVLGISRPGDYVEQNAAYNGHKRNHDWNSKPSSSPTVSSLTMMNQHLVADMTEYGKLTVTWMPRLMVSV